MLSARGQTENVFKDVENTLGAPVHKNNVFFKNHLIPIVRQTRQATIRLGLEPLLSPGRPAAAVFDPTALLRRGDPQLEEYGGLSLD